MKIAVVRKTSNLEHDDRLRKETGSIKGIYPDAQIKVYVIHDENKESEGRTSYGLEFKSVYLKTRDEYPSGGHLMAKIWNYFKVVKKDLKHYDILWVSGLEMAPMLLFVRGMKKVWDLRELPHEYMGNSLKHFVLKRMFHRSQVLIHANQERLDYLIQKGLVKSPDKHFVLKNYPDFSQIDDNYDTRYEEVKSWIAGRKCIYLQGLSNKSRASVESIETVLAIPDLCAIVLGNFDKDARKLLESKYGDEFTRRICIAGNFNVLKVPQYMKLCQMSMVFYKNTRLNNWLCEPNRMYQAINTGLPVLVGANPTMKNLVEAHSYGIVADTDGSDVDIMVEGLNKMIANYESYAKNLDMAKTELLWSNQNEEMREILEIIN